ncbi:winged helix-turn-helix transcriptional regulator [Nocardia sp. NPDC057227]|uniref:winged helix-turn-helix transcriptional regulator n=1 Tax=Nocardia sp. NPDC057227 TaxID=3346056 RepID=UPI00363E1337
MDRYRPRPGIGQANGAPLADGPLPPPQRVRREHAGTDECPASSITTAPDESRTTCRTPADRAAATKLVLTALARGPLRFAELHRLIEGISEKMLSQTLRVLVRDGLIRTVEPATPPRVSYALSELGHGLTDSLHPFPDWIYRHLPDVASAQDRHDQDRR